MATTLLVPLDGTPEAEAALPVARALATTTGGALALVRAVTRANPQGARLATAYLERLAAQMRADGFEATSLVRTGVPAQVIVAAAAEQKAGFVVMATHGRTGVQRALRGSVADRVLTHTTVPLLLVRPGGKAAPALKTIVVPVDGTPGSTLAIGAAAGLASASGATLQLIQVVVAIPYWATSIAALSPGSAPVDPWWDLTALETAQTYVKRAAQHLRQSGLTVQGTAVVGDVAPSVVDLADRVDADLIVVATHAYTGPTRTLLGSVADELVRSATRPVLLVRRPDPSDAAAAPMSGTAHARRQGHRRADRRGGGADAVTPAPEAGDAVGIDEDTGEAAGIGGVIGAALGSAGGPVGVALGAAGGMVVGAAAELAVHAGSRLRRRR